MNIEDQISKRWKFIYAIVAIKLFLVASVIFLPFPINLAFLPPALIYGFVGLYLIGTVSGMEKSKEYINDSIEHNARIVANLLIIGTKVFLAGLIQRKLAKMPKRGKRKIGNKGVGAS